MKSIEEFWEFLRVFESFRELWEFWRVLKSFEEKEFLGVLGSFESFDECFWVLRVLMIFGCFSKLCFLSVFNDLWVSNVIYLHGFEKIGSWEYSEDSE